MGPRKTKGTLTHRDPAQLVKLPLPHRHMEGPGMMTLQDVDPHRRQHDIYGSTSQDSAAYFRIVQEGFAISSKNCLSVTPTIN